MFFISGQITGNRKSCQSSADIVFLIDGSASIGRDFKRQITLINHVVDYFGGVSESVHAAVVVIETRSNVQIRLTDYEDNQKFKDAISKVRIPNSYKEVHFILNRRITHELIQ